MMNRSYLNGIGLIPVDATTTAPTDFVGATHRERKYIGALIARRNYLMVKLQDGAGRKLQYENAERAALNWAIQLLQEHFILLNEQDGLTS